MQRQATYEDSNLILHLYEVRREERLRKARVWMVSSFYVRTYAEYAALCPPGSEESASFRMVASYWEMAASFVANGVLHPELFFQNNQELLLIWERIRDVVAEARVQTKNPNMYVNLEKVAKENIAWLDRTNPGYFALFSERIRTRPAVPAPAVADSPRP
ncbi:MAG TPA: hypothetical protein VGS22_15410 [Thermoanaerobaculia bacterium]|jgi:hypothetical protein|nr:hypothetical protein [Thermoanaerobaculia bacterium]